MYQVVRIHIYSSSVGMPETAYGGTDSQQLIFLLQQHRRQQQECWWPLPFCNTTTILYYLILVMQYMRKTTSKKCQVLYQAKLKLNAVFETVFANISKYVRWRSSINIHGTQQQWKTWSSRLLSLNNIVQQEQYTWAGSCRTAAEAEKIKLGHRFLAATTTLLFSPPWLDNNNIAQQGSSITMYTIGSVMKKGTLMSMAIVHAMPITYLLYYKNFINFPKILEM